MNISEKNTLLLLEFVPYTYKVQMLEMGVITRGEFDTLNDVERLVMNEQFVTPSQTEEHRRIKQKVLSCLIMCARVLCVINPDTINAINYLGGSKNPLSILESVVTKASKDTKEKLMVLCSKKVSEK